MLKSYWVFLFVAIICCVSWAQTPDEGQFGCSRQTRYFERIDLGFVPITDPQTIEAWQSRPGVTFDISGQEHAYTSVVFYGQRVPLPGADLRTTARLKLAVRLVGPRGEQWFGLEQQNGNAKAPLNKLLYVGRELTGGDDQSDQSDGQNSEGSSGPWLKVAPATPDPALPIFVLQYEFQDQVKTATSTVENRLLVDLRSGRPQLKAVQCIDWESAGACGAPAASSIANNLRCLWDNAARDFRCTMTEAFGPSTAMRAASRDFYLFEGKTAVADWYNAETPPDLGSLALRLSKDPGAPASNIVVPQLGPVTLLTRYKDLVPGSEVFVFGSPGAQANVSAQFSLVTVPAQGPPTVQSIRESEISGQNLEQNAAQAGFTPVPAADVYRAAAIEDRTGFHSLQVVMGFAPGQNSNLPEESSNLLHALYWVGLEASNHGLIASAIRVASEGSIPGDCGQVHHDATAISLQPQSGMTAATIRVRPAESSADPRNTQSAACVWIGALYWKPGTGFDVQKTGDDCDAGMPEISISEDGQITPQTTDNPE